MTWWTRHATPSSCTHAKESNTWKMLAETYEMRGGLLRRMGSSLHKARPSLCEARGAIGGIAYLHPLGCCKGEDTWDVEARILPSATSPMHSMAVLAPVNGRSVPRGWPYQSNFHISVASYAHLSHEQQHSKRAVHPSAKGQRPVPPDPYRCHVTRVVPPSFPANRANFPRIRSLVPLFGGLRFVFRHEIVFETDVLCICHVVAWTCEPANERVQRRKEGSRSHVDVVPKGNCWFVAVEREMRRQKMAD